VYVLQRPGAGQTKFVKPKIKKWCKLSRGVKAKRRKTRDALIHLYHEYLRGYEETIASMSRFIETYWDKLTIFCLWVHVALQKQNKKKDTQLRIT